MKQAKSGAKAERNAVVRAMVDAGCSVEAVVVELTRRWGFRPRTAFRHAHGWSQDELASRLSQMIARLQPRDQVGPDETVPVVVGRRIGEYERWPVGGRRPSPYMLMVLAEAFDTSVDRLLDREDHAHLPPAEAAVLAALAAAQRAPLP